MLLGANSAPFPEVKRMNHITITLHTITVGGGGQIQYARVVEKRGHDTIGRSVMPYRLTSIQLREARIAERANQQAPGTQQMGLAN